LVIFKLNPSNMPTYLFSLAWPDPHSTPRERVWDMAIQRFDTYTMECVLITLQYSVTCYLKYVIKGKIQNLSMSGE